MDSTFTFTFSHLAELLSKATYNWEYSIPQGKKHNDNICRNVMNAIKMNVICRSVEQGYEIKCINTSQKEGYFIQYSSKTFIMIKNINHLYISNGY